MRLRMTFCKNQAMRYTGHLDVQRALERTFRRARLPLAYSQGFSPHAKINLAAPLPLGFTSEGEVTDFWLEEDHEISASEVHSQLEDTLPPGLEIVHLERIEDNKPSLQSSVTAAEYRLTSPEFTPNIIRSINDLLGREHILRTRRHKEYDLRPLILSISTVLPEDGALFLMMCLSATEGKTGRPEEVLDTLQITPQRVLIHRTKLIFARL